MYLLSAVACTRTLYALCIGPGWILEGGTRASTHLSGGSVPCRVERQEVHGHIARFRIYIVVAKLLTNSYN